MLGPVFLRGHVSMLGKGGGQNHLHNPLNLTFGEITVKDQRVHPSLLKSLRKKNFFCRNVIFCS